MAILCFANGNSQAEFVKIKEGQEWEIDKYTTQFEDSSDIRNKNKALYQEFQQRYPDKACGVHFYRETEEGIKEWKTLYRKHLVAFQKIIENPSFMYYFSRRKKEFFSQYDIRILSYYRKEVASHMKKYCREMKKKDEQEYHMKNGGPRYFAFVREVVFQYSMYLPYHSNEPTIDGFYEAYQSEKKKKQKPTTSREEVHIPRTYQVPVFHPWQDRLDPDTILYDEMDREELEVDSLDAFLSSPHFDKRYAGIMEEKKLALLGNTPEDLEEKERYQYWYQACHNGFEGELVAPLLESNKKNLPSLENMNYCLFLLWRREQALERQIAIALQNKASVALICYDTNLVSFYQKKFPSVTFIFGDEKKKKEEFNDFMIDLYNQEYGKKYYLS